MDMLRSCYRTKMDFGAAPYRAVPVRWFFCDDSALYFPGLHRFASANWTGDKHLKWHGPGEIQGVRRVWDDGNNANRKLGDHYCGDLKYFQQGLRGETVSPNPECCPSLPDTATVSVSACACSSAFIRP